MASRETFGALCRRGDRRARSWRHDRRLSRLRFGCPPPQDARGRLGLRLCDGGVFEPQAGAGDLRQRGVPLCRRQRPSRPRHDRHIQAAVSQGDRGAVRPGAAACARDGRAEDWHDRPRWDEDPRQRQPSQRAVLGARAQARGTTESRGGGPFGARRGGGRGRCPRRPVNSRRAGVAREAFGQARRGAREDRSAGERAIRARAGRARGQTRRARGQDRHDRQEAWRQAACAARRRAAAEGPDQSH